MVSRSQDSTTHKSTVASCRRMAFFGHTTAIVPNMLEGRLFLLE